MLLAVAGVLPCGVIQAETGRLALVQFSNGEIVEGTISLTPGAELKIHTGAELKTLTLDLVQEATFEPEKETMEQKWRFPEAGRTQKEKWGRPFPVREIRAAIWLADGTVLRGHVYTTVLYMEGKEQTTKVVLRAKDRGSEGQTFADIVYPVRVSFRDRAQSVAGTISLKIKDSDATELVALTPGALLRLPASRTPDGRAFQLAGLTTTNAFVAVRTGSGINVGWPADSDTGLVVRVREGLGNAEDFFDVKTLFGAFRSGDDVYTLLLLSRKGQTTMEGDKSLPWRLEVWRWKDNGDRMMVAGRGFFYRGILSKDELPPPVSVSPGIWSTELKDGAELP